MFCQCLLDYDIIVSPCIGMHHSVYACLHAALPHQRPPLLKLSVRRPAAGSQPPHVTCTLLLLCVFYNVRHLQPIGTGSALLAILMDNLVPKFRHLVAEMPTAQNTRGTNRV